MQRVIPLIPLFNLIMMPTTRPWTSCFQVFLEMNLIEFVIKIAHKIWSRLQSFHEGTNAVKARLFETYRREYENFVQLPGESVETLFSRFQSCVISNQRFESIINLARVNLVHTTNRHSQESHMATFRQLTPKLLPSHPTQGYYPHLLVHGRYPAAFSMLIVLCLNAALPPNMDHSV